MFFCVAKGWRDKLVKQILNNDALTIVDKEKWQEVQIQNKQMIFDNKQILKLAVLITFLLSIAIFLMQKLLLSKERKKSLIECIKFLEKAKLKS